ncbi:Membrane protein [Candidatus Xenohaliotis californiensis]|uniref:Membrane protein n=1 Tax=Candidatus Xenohaliotis californiensis TaxID=84677 RepID=A0ABP0EU42_9RICK|nr:Membrane protein [Candidatus Xenohaliotis californiensis]
MLFKQTHTATASSAKYDVGLREYTLSVYRYMSIALLITAISAFAVASMPKIFYLVHSTPIGWLFSLAPIIFVIYFTSRIHTMPLSMAQNCLWGFSGVMGVSLSSLLLVFKIGGMAKAFFITASMFGAMNIYGHTTNRDLTELGSFMIMGLIGILIASLVNIFARSSAMQFAISFISVIVFTGLTAYDAQKIKSLYYQYSDSEQGAKMAIIGALNLYFDFINIFISMLYLMGDNKR